MTIGGQAIPEIDRRGRPDVDRNLARIPADATPLAEHANRS
jgi:hypothetical protein